MNLSPTSIEANDRALAAAANSIAELEAMMSDKNISNETHLSLVNAVLALRLQSNSLNHIKRLIDIEERHSAFLDQLRS